MNQFQIAIKQGDIKCDICGAAMLPMIGGGWENDRIMCSDGRNCGAEIVYPTSTPIDSAVDGENEKSNVSNGKSNEVE